MSEQQWEFFRDICYYDMWAVRPVGDKDFSSQKLFHVQSEEEAQALADILNTRTPDPRIAELQREIDYLRRYGNKDCMNMADVAMEEDAVKGDSDE